MRGRWILALVALALAGGAASAWRARSLLVGTAAPPPVSPTPLVEATPRRLPPLALPRVAPVTAAPRPPAPRERPLTAAPPPDTTLAPSILIAPRPEALPPLPNLAAAPAPTPVLPGPNLAAAPPPPSSPADLLSVVPPPQSNGPWEETETKREPPEISVYNDTRLVGELVLNGAADYDWDWRRSGLVVSTTVEPGEYRYELRGPVYTLQGEPDQVGTLRCRKFHLYRIHISERRPRDGNGTLHRDIGDNP